MSDPLQGWGPAVAAAGVHPSRVRMVERARLCAGDYAVSSQFGLKKVASLTWHGALREYTEIRWVGAENSVEAYPSNWMIPRVNVRTSRRKSPPRRLARADRLTKLQAGYLFNLSVLLAFILITFGLITAIFPAVIVGVLLGYYCVRGVSRRM